MEISKELIENVLERNIVSFTIHSGFIFIQEKSISHNLNIYEFAFKCKEWAFKNGGYVLQSQSYTIKDYKFAKGAFCYTHFFMGGMGNSHWADTEVEAIIKACEWILKQTGN